MSELAVTATQPATPAAPPPPPPAEAVPSGQNPAEQAPATDATPEKAEATDEQPEKRSQSRFERRLSKVYRKYGEEKARADFLEKQLTELKTPKTPIPEGAPRLEQFDDIEKYADAKAEWAKAQALKDHEAKQRTTAQQEQHKKLLAAWEEKVEAAGSKYDDFDEVVGELQPNNPLIIAMMREENGADVAHFLAKNHKEASKLIGLDPIDQVLAIGRLAAKLSSEPPAAKQPSKAPPPIAPVSGKAAAPTEEISPDDDMKTFIRKRERQLGRRT